MATTTASTSKTMPNFRQRCRLRGVEVFLSPTGIGPCPAVSAAGWTMSRRCFMRCEFWPHPSIEPPIHLLSYNKLRDVYVAVKGRGAEEKSRYISRDNSRNPERIAARVATKEPPGVTPPGRNPHCH